MAASWRLNEGLEKADARIKAASETLGRYFPLSDSLEQARVAKLRILRNPLQIQLRKHEAFANILEEIAAHVEAHQETIAANAELPEDLPGRNALIRAGHTSTKSVKALSEDDLLDIDGIGATTAKRIVSVLNPPKPATPTPAKSVARKEAQSLPTSPSPSPETESVSVPTFPAVPRVVLTSPGKEPIATVVGIGLPKEASPPFDSPIETKEED